MRIRVLVYQHSGSVQSHGTRPTEVQLQPTRHPRLHRRETPCSGRHVQAGNGIVVVCKVAVWREDLAPHDINRPGFLAGEAGKREASCIALALQQDIGILRAGQRQTVLRPGQPDAGIGAFTGAAAILQRVLRQRGIVTRRIVPGVILKEQARQLRFAVDPARAVAAHAGKATHGRRYRCGGMRESGRSRSSRPPPP